MTPTLVRFADVPASPWANGRGTTRELWRTPLTGDIAARLSIATVAEPSEFSALPGIDRALLVLAPAGLTLRIDGSERMLNRYDVAEFAGEQAVEASVVPEPGFDLNLMVRRGTGRPRLEALAVHGAGSLASGALALVCVDGRIGCRFDAAPAGGASTATLAFGDALVGHPDTPLPSLTVTGAGMLAVAALL